MEHEEVLNQTEYWAAYSSAGKQGGGWESYQYIDLKNKTKQKTSWNEFIGHLKNMKYN